MQAELIVEEVAQLLRDVSQDPLSLDASVASADFAVADLLGKIIS